MHPVLRNILAVIAGLVAGSAINMGLIMFSSVVIPPPDGADLTTTEGLEASMHLMQPRHFIFPFLAHAAGTFAGALLAALIAATRKMIVALLAGLFFFAGGYFPMAWIAGRIASRNK